MSSSGTVSECLTELDKGVDTIGTSFSNTYGVRWALGAQGAELNNTNTSDWRFVKIDGIEPTLDKVARGKYKDWVELTFQTNKSHVFDTNEKALINEIIKAAGNPVVLSATNKAAKHTWGQSGFMAAPLFYNPASNGAVSLTKPVNPFSHATIESGSTEAQDVNNCRMPAVYDLGTSRGIQVK
ncbi:hypothetical protein [Methylocucumis oryzae]|uniref:Uncharacterized protein n=1 Tax=Methylocucumis oryzae TaxID=1632867 RepID=A0A0F3IKK2_9GAMM|nr:hypothetical protein [Methylocucumis oryzae]KJV07048.1 hypothetical protein VZ94_07240 [Methylocucumis oryzae]